MTRQGAAQGAGSPDLAVGEVYGLRSFLISKDGALLPLSPFGNDAPWESGTNTATCSIGGQHQVPEEKCTCGFYFYNDERWIEKELSQNFAQVRAVVACSGRIRVGDRGFRAQRGRIVALWVSQHVPDEVVNAILGRYPEAVLHRSLRRMKSDFPLDQPGRDSHVPQSGTRKMLGRWGGAAVEEAQRFQVRRLIITALVALLAMNVPANQSLLLGGAYLGSAIGLTVISRIVTDRGSARLLMGWGWVLMGVLIIAAISVFLPSPAPPLGIGVIAGLFASGLPWRLSSFRSKPRLLEGPQALDRLAEHLGDGTPRPLGQVLVNGVICTPFEYPRTMKIVVITQSTIIRETIDSAILRVLPGPQSQSLQTLGLGGSIGPRVKALVHLTPEHPHHGVRAETLIMDRHHEAIQDHVRALPLKDILSVLGVKEPVWIPEACRPPLAESWATGQSMSSHPPALRGLHLRHPDAQAALEHAHVLSRRKAYHDTQRLIALSGLSPAQSVSLPPTLPATPRHVLLRGWAYLLHLPVSGDTARITPIFLDALPTLPLGVDHLEYDPHSTGKVLPEEPMQVGHLVALERYSGVLTRRAEPHLADQWWCTSDPHRGTFTIGPLGEGGHTTIRFSAKDGEPHHQHRLDSADSVDHSEDPDPEGGWQR